ncbi:MAG: class I SAM-dependent methyltransferase [Clostridia bacterium]
MWTSEDFKDYEILDATDGMKLERFGDYILVRPDPQIIWSTGKKHPLWNKYDAKYNRSSQGGGSWEIKKLPETFNISYKNLNFILRPMNFKHTGIFPEQAPNWDYMMDLIKKQTRPIKVLNLFAYTGAATIACASAGAAVTHVDAAKGIIALAKENAKASGLLDAEIRYLVDDCSKFIEREIRRGNKYDAIIMDPPSYGRGPGGEVWKIEELLYPLLLRCSEILKDDPLFFVLNSYSQGLSAMTMSYMLQVTVGSKFKNKVQAAETGLYVTTSGLYLPCGNTARVNN